MIALVTLILSVVVFCIAGLVTASIGVAKIWLLLGTTVCLIGVAVLEAKYTKARFMYRTQPPLWMQKYRHLWPVPFLIATCIWVFDPALGIAPFVVAIMIGGVQAYGVLTLHNARRADCESLQADMKSDPYLMIVHVSGAPTSAYQVNQWIPVLEKLPFRVAIVSRDEKLSEAITPGTITVINAVPIDVMAKFIGYGVKVILYPANGASNAHVLRHSECTHIFINHGESDKNVNQSKFLLAYDYLFVAGPLAKDRLTEAKLNFRDDQVRFVGRPQAELLLTHQDDSVPLKQVLYAPTWEGFTEVANFGSIRDMGLRIVQDLAAMDGMDIVFKPHPFTGRRCKRTEAELKKIYAFCSEKGIPVLSKSDSLYDAMNASHLLITDISSVLNDYLITGKPIVLCRPGADDGEDVGAEFASANAAYILRGDDSVPTLITDIVTTDSLAAKRHEVRTYSLGEYENGAFDEFVSQLTDVTTK